MIAQNGCAVETVDPDGTPSLSSVFITLQGTEGGEEGAVSGVHSSNLRLHQRLRLHLLTSPLTVESSRRCSSRWLDICLLAGRALGLQLDFIRDVS